MSMRRNGCRMPSRRRTMMDARLAAIAERAFLRKLDGSCRTPIAAHFWLTSMGAEMQAEKCCRTKATSAGAPRARSKAARPEFDAESAGSSRWPRMSPPSAPMILARRRPTGPRSRRERAAGSGPRSEPGASNTAERLTAAGYRSDHRARARDLAHRGGHSPVRRLAFTSANGVRQFAQLSPRRDAPAFCVGERTAR